MFSHRQVWIGIEALAKEKQITLSRLAKQAGLDATCLNPSKRFTKNGKERWITLQSLSRILNATDTKFSDFAKLVERM